MLRCAQLAFSVLFVLLVSSTALGQKASQTSPSGTPRNALLTIPTTLPSDPPTLASTPDTRGSSASDAGSVPANGVVILERAGRSIGLGFVLGGDGRIVSSLSVIGDGNGIDARYADGSLVALKTGHADRAWNVVLLVPQARRWAKGLYASAVDPLARDENEQGSSARSATVQVFSMRSRSVAMTPVHIKDRVEVLGGDGVPLRDAIEIGKTIPSHDVGTPLVDAQGKVVGIVTTACKPSKAKSGGACQTTPIGVPMSVLRQFLRGAPSGSSIPGPWLGVQGVSETTPTVGIRVTRVFPGSPAAAIGLRDGSDGRSADTVVAFDGASVGSVEALANMVTERAIGDTVVLIVLREGRFYVVQTVLTGYSAVLR